MDERDGAAASNRSRLDQFYPSKKKRESPRTGKSPSGRRKSLDDTSPYKKGSLDSFLVCSRSPSSQQSQQSGQASQEDDARSADVRPSIKTSLCSRIEESSRTTGLTTNVNHEVSVNHEVELGLAVDNEVTDVNQDEVKSLTSVNSCFKDQDPTQAAVHKLNDDLTPFANEVLSIFLSGLPSTNNQVDEPSSSRKRELPALPTPGPKKRHVDIAGNDQKLDFSMLTTRDDHGETSVHNMVTPEVGSQGRKVLSRCSKPPCTPHSRSSDKGLGRITPNGWMIQSKYCSPGDAFWEEAIKANNALLDPSGATSTERAMVSGRNLGLDSPLPIRRFDFGAHENDDGSTTVKQAMVEPRLEQKGPATEPKEAVFTKHEEAPKTEVPSKPEQVPETKSEVVTDPKKPESLPMTELRYWLPQTICDVYARKGLKQLYQWQVDCLLLEGVLDGKSLVYCASTSAGKSLVAEILMLRRVISSEAKAMLVLPYVALCSEKAEHLESLLEPLGKRVRCFFGHQGGATLSSDTSVAVCTIEKANSLVNKLIEEGRLSELALVVIDELHMVGDRDRGYLLELMLTKLRYAAGKDEKAPENGSLQILGMSATMPNVQAVASWLEAAFYQTDFRPVPLDEYIKVGRVIYNTNMETVRVLREGSDLGGKDQEHVVELCNEVVRQGHSALLFCSSRHACETSARHVAKFLPKFTVVHRENATGYKDGNEAVEDLRKCPAGLDPVLADTLPAGVAYHHAGLTAEEREIIEACYRQGVVRVLAATSTLAAGVNLPARRVIFRQPKVGCDFLDATRYRQMAGRAGRAGIDTMGESILICKPEEVNRMLPVLKEGCQPLRSCLSEDRNGMMRALLEVVAGGVVQTSGDVDRYVRCTLLNSTQSFDNVAKSAQDSLRWLCHKRLIEWDNEQRLYRTTPLGKAAFGSSLTPEESLVVFEDLAKARESFVLSCDLHVVYEVTPIYVELEPDWGVYYQKFLQLSHIEQAVANRVGVTEGFLMRMAHGAPMQPSRNARGFTKSSTLLPAAGQQNGMDQTLRIYRRFYVAIILANLVQEMPLMEVCASFKVPRGTVQALQDSAGRFAAMVATFCERLGWHDLEGLVSKFQSRVSFGVRAEIASLTEIPFVKAARARALYKAGLRTVQSVAEATISELTAAIFDSSSKAFQDGSRQQWLHAAMAKKIKNGARKIVLDQAEEARKAAFSAFQALGVTVPKSLSEPIRARIEDSDTDIGELVAAVKKCEAEVARPERVQVEVEVRNNDENQDFQGSVVNKLVRSDDVRPPPAKFEDKGPVDVDKMEGGFQAFILMWEGVKDLFFDLHIERQAVGGLWEIVGMAICWNDSLVYYVRISVDTDVRWNKLCGLFGCKGVGKFCWDLKKQMKALEKPGFSADTNEAQVMPVFQNASAKKLVSLSPMAIEEEYTDLRLVAWLLWPDEDSSASGSLEQMVTKRLPGDAAGAAARSGRWMNQMGKVTHNGCCRRVAQVRALHSVFRKLLQPEGLQEPLQNIEMPLVKVLVNMESWPIGVDMKACLNARSLLERRIKQLESKAQVLTGMNFSLSLPADVADLLYKHLKLPVPKGSKGKQHPSTDKQALEVLRDKHPVIGIIKEHRTLSKLLQTTIGTVSTCAKRSEDNKYYIVGQWLHTSTGTGRLSMEEPNLQCVEHSIRFSLDDGPGSEAQQVEVIARDFFVPTQENWVLLSADYSQIELRFLAHFSEDEALIALLTKPTGDVFRMMTAQWTSQAEAEVSDKQREQTKRMVYGILYGMGINTLAEKMECAVAEARNYHDRFKAAFPGVSVWVQQAVQSCRQNGFVKTIAGRKRYLEKINDSKRGDQAKAERQAVNSICQGSAADIIKMAMIDFHLALVGKSSKSVVLRDGNGTSKTVSYSVLCGKCHLLLQIHDELVVEVDKDFVGEASAIIRACMEGAATLKVPLNVKLQTGPSWGQLHSLPV